jgi:hypothetical protein
MDLCAHIAAWALRNNVSQCEPTFTEHCTYLVSVGTVNIYDAGIFDEAPTRRYIIVDQANKNRHAVVGNHNGFMFLVDESKCASRSAKKETVIHYMDFAKRTAYAAASCIGTGIFLTLHKGQEVVVLAPVKTIGLEAWVLVAVAYPIFPGSATGYVRADCLTQTRTDYDINFGNAGCMLEFAPNPQYVKQDPNVFKSGDRMVSKQLKSKIINDYGIMLEQKDNTTWTVIYSTVDNITVGDTVAQYGITEQVPNLKQVRQKDPNTALIRATLGVINVTLQNRTTSIRLNKKGTYHIHDFAWNGSNSFDDILIDGQTFHTLPDLRIYARNNENITVSYEEQRPTGSTPPKWSDKPPAHDGSGLHIGKVALLNAYGPNSALNRALFLPKLDTVVRVPHIPNTAAQLELVPGIYVHANNVYFNLRKGDTGRSCGTVYAVVSDDKNCYLHGFVPTPTKESTCYHALYSKIQTSTFEFNFPSVANRDDKPNLYGTKMQIGHDSFECVVHPDTMLWKEGLWTGDMVTPISDTTVSVLRKRQVPANIQYERNVTILDGTLNGRPLEWCNGEYLPTMSHAFRPHVEVAVVYAAAPIGPKGALLAKDTATQTKIVLDGPYAGNRVDAEESNHKWLYLQNSAPPSITFRRNACIGTATTLQLTAGGTWTAHTAQPAQCSMAEWFKAWPDTYPITNNTLKTVVSNLQKHDQQLGYALETAFNDKMAAANYEEQVIIAFGIDLQDGNAYKISGRAKALIDSVGKRHSLYNTLVTAAPYLDSTSDLYELDLLHDMLENKDDEESDPVIPFESTEPTVVLPDKLYLYSFFDDVIETIRNFDDQSKLYPSFLVIAAVMDSIQDHLFHTHDTTELQDSISTIRDILGDPFNEFAAQLFGTNDDLFNSLKDTVNQNLDIDSDNYSDRATSMFDEFTKFVLNLEEPDEVNHILQQSGVSDAINKLRANNDEKKKASEKAEQNQFGTEHPAKQEIYVFNASVIKAVLDSEDPFKFSPSLCVVRSIADKTMGQLQNTYDCNDLVNGLDAMSESVATFTTLMDSQNPTWTMSLSKECDQFLKDIQLEPEQKATIIFTEFDALVRNTHRQSTHIDTILEHSGITQTVKELKKKFNKKQQDGERGDGGDGDAEGKKGGDGAANVEEVPKLIRTGSGGDSDTAKDPARENLNRLNQIVANWKNEPNIHKTLTEFKKCANLSFNHNANDVYKQQLFWDILKYAAWKIKIKSDTPGPIKTKFENPDDTARLCRRLFYPNETFDKWVTKMAGESDLKIVWNEIPSGSILAFNAGLCKKRGVPREGAEKYLSSAFDPDESL